MSTVHIKINGIPHEVEEGTTILDAAKRVQVKIPTLCYHPDLPAWAACGLCVIRVKGSPKMMRACATPVSEGLEVVTHDPEIVEVRRTVLELILSTHPNDCLQCPRSGTYWSESHATTITRDSGRVQATHTGAPIRHVRQGLQRLSSLLRNTEVGNSAV